jgi:ESS family glutamate:Na+ symporter
MQIVGLASIGLLIGEALKSRFRLLDRLNIPVPVVGGMVFALASLLLRDRYVNFDADPTLRDLFQIAFMTTIGLSARVRLLRAGGAQLIVMLALASVGAVLQNGLGIGLAKALGIDARLGILAGSVALAGGPATSIAFGGTFEKLGVTGASAVALASATFGITVSGLIGGYIGGRLIRSHGLKSTADEVPHGESERVAQAGALLPSAIAIGVAMGIGNLISAGVERLGVVLPAYIGAMLVAAVIRNLDDRFGFAHIAQGDVDAIGRVTVNLFIVMALLTLRLWELAHLALPLITILAAQVALCWLMCVAMSFPLLGRDYESAVMASGFCGFMLGVTVNAVACMEELVEKYGPAPRAFLVVPVVGAFLIDFTNSLIITAFANFTSR